MAKQPNNDAERFLSEQRAAQQKSVEETEARMNSSRPTPTQEENDRAKLGLEVELEPDGSEPDPNNQSVVGNTNAPAQAPQAGEQPAVPRQQNQPPNQGGGMNRETRTK
jgi:hypothetical protein